MSDQIKGGERGYDASKYYRLIVCPSGNLLSGSVERLPQGSIDIKRMKDANSEKRAQAVVQSVEFHPTANVILTAGFHKTLDLFQVSVVSKS